MPVDEQLADAARALAGVMTDEDPLDRGRAGYVEINDDVAQVELQAGLAAGPSYVESHKLQIAWDPDWALSYKNTFLLWLYDLYGDVVEIMDYAGLDADAFPGRTHRARRHLDRRLHGRRLRLAAIRTRSRLRAVDRGGG